MSFANLTADNAQRMKIVIAPDSFKECMGAEAVARAIAEGIASVCPGAELVCLPLADGGEGTAEIVTRALGGILREVPVHGPMGRPVTAFYGRVGDTVILDVASAIGLSLVPPSERNPLVASSRGVGELMLQALRDGCRKMVVGLGGSATCDGGAGMLEVEGLRESCRGVEIQVLCDVENPFTGPSGTARVFAPQKGADEPMVEVLEARMVAMAETILRETGLDVTTMKGAGAAGGLGGALAACLGARLVPGIDTVLELIGFREAVSGADYIITGEGSSDAQTLSGKVPMGVLRHSEGVPVVLLSGRIKDDSALREAGFSRLVQVTPEGTPLQEALREEVARENLIRSAAGWAASALI